jgi:hypothetical protein
MRLRKQACNKFIYCHVRDYEYVTHGIYYIPKHHADGVSMVLVNIDYRLAKHCGRYYGVFQGDARYVFGTLSHPLE